MFEIDDKQGQIRADNFAGKYSCISHYCNKFNTMANSAKFPIPSISACANLNRGALQVIYS
jgi:hypothetical protein